MPLKKKKKKPFHTKYKAKNRISEFSAKNNFCPCVNLVWLGMLQFKKKILMAVYLFDILLSLQLPNLLPGYNGNMINRTGVAGAALQTPPSLIRWVGQRFFSSRSSKHFFWTKWWGQSVEGRPRLVLADLGKTLGCYTKTVVIITKSLIESSSSSPAITAPRSLNIIHNRQC